MIRCSIAIATVALGLIGSSVMMPATIQAVADTAAPDSAGGRYMFETRPDGFIRLDTQTGEVAWCSQRAVGLACEAAPEDRAVLEDEIARLTAENAALKKEILARGLPLPPGATAGIGCGAANGAQRRHAAIAKRRRYRSHGRLCRPAVASLHGRRRARRDAGLEQELGLRLSELSAVRTARIDTIGNGGVDRGDAGRRFF